MARVFGVIVDVAEKSAKVLAGSFSLQLNGWLELSVAAVAVVTVLYLGTKLLLALPLVRHLVVGTMAFALVEAVLSTAEMFGWGFGLTAEQIFGAAVAAAGVCLVLSIRRSRREARALKWEREYNSQAVADKLEATPKPVAPVTVKSDEDEDDDEVIARRLTALWNEAPHTAKRLRALETEVERLKRLLGAQHASEPEPGLFDSDSSSNK